MPEYLVTKTEGEPDEDATKFVVINGDVVEIENLYAGPQCGKCGSWQPCEEADPDAYFEQDGQWYKDAGYTTGSVFVTCNQCREVYPIQSDKQRY